MKYNYFLHLPYLLIFYAFSINPWVIENYNFFILQIYILNLISLYFINKPFEKTKIILIVITIVQVLSFLFLLFLKNHILVGIYTYFYYQVLYF